MPIDPRRLLVLRAVRRAGGVGEAARVLHLTPSAVSQHLSRLEEETGVTIVDRSRRGGGRTVALTNAGLALADQGERVAEALTDAERDIASLRGRTAGPVTIGGFAVAMRRLVAPAVVELAVTHPGVKPRVQEIDEPPGLALLRAGRIDLLLVERSADAPRRPTRGVVEEDLLRDPYRIVVPEGWAQTDDATILRGPWVGGYEGVPARVALDELGKAHDVALDIAHLCHESSTALVLVGAGLGSAMISELTIDYLQRSGIRIPASSLVTGARMLVVLRRSGRAELSPAATALLDALRNQAASG